MSTIPLSLREGHGQTLSGTDAPLSAACQDDDCKLDALVDNVAETIAGRDAPNGKRDEILVDVSSEDEGDTWCDLKAKLEDPEAAIESMPASEVDRWRSAIRTSPDCTVSARPRSSAARNYGAHSDD